MIVQAKPNEWRDDPRGIVIRRDSRPGWFQVVDESGRYTAMDISLPVEYREAVRGVRDSSG